MNDLSRLILWSYGWDGGTWSVASLKKTWVKLVYSEGRETLGFAFSVVMVSSVAVVSLAMNGKFERNCLQLSQSILLIWQLFKECWRYWSSMIFKLRSKY